MVRNQFISGRFYKVIGQHPDDQRMTIVERGGEKIVFKTRELEEA